MSGRPPSFNAGRRGSAKARSSFAFFSKPTIQIALDGVDCHDGPCAKIYTTMDEIRGTVIVTANQETRFDEIDIALSGRVKVAVEKVAPSTTMSGRMDAEKEFLNLKQPIEPSAYPTPRIIEPGRTYTFPFTFTIPEQLPSRSCAHPAANAAVRDAHHQLPPTISDSSTWKVDDMAPDMGKIKYGIRVNLIRTQCSEGNDRIVADKTRKIRVLPAIDEDPPLSVDDDDEYTLRSERNVRKSLFGGKMGRLVAETRQPSAFHLPAPGNDDGRPVSTTATLNLRFDPADGINAPPRLATLTSKLKAYTYYRLTPSRDFPSKFDAMNDMTSGVHFVSVNLSTRDMASTQWRFHPASDSRPQADSMTRNPSVTSESGHMDIPNASGAYRSGGFYTAHLPIPLTLPKDKFCTPTFHSCLLSRVYRLDLNLSIHAPKPSAPSVTLKVPIQISSDRSVSATRAIRNMSVVSAVEAAAEADAAFAPRIISPVHGDFAERSQSIFGSGPTGSVAGGESPPDYQAFAPSSHRLTVF